MFIFDETLLILIPAMIFSIWAHFKLRSTYKKYSQVHNRRGMTGAQAARAVLDANGLSYVRIEHIAGDLTDHYDPRDNVIRLSDTVYGSTSVAALGVAAHEAGHAVQHATGYVPVKIRAAIIPATRIGSMLAGPTFLVGMLVTASAQIAPIIGEYLMLAGILLFTVATLFQLVTLPTEFNASARAMKALESGGMLADDELPAARKTLTAAAMTYVAALASSLASLLRLIMIFNGNRRN